jgi:branched-chain amino acid aminotransferase
LNRGVLAIVDGALVPVEEATVPATDEGLLRGDGAFEVIRLYDGRPFAFEDHLRRLSGSLAGLRLEADLVAVRREVEALLDEAEPGDENGAVRIVITRGGRRIAILEPLDPFETAIRLATITYAPTRILDGIKSLSYAANRLASRVAQEQGADEALLVTPHGRVLEAPTAAFFWVRDGTLLTPPLEDHILDSITRRRLMAALDAREESLPLADLDTAEEAFLASTTREVQAVCAIDGRELAGAPGPRTREAAEAFDRVVAAELAGA